MENLEDNWKHAKILLKDNSKRCWMMSSFGSRDKMICSIIILIFSIKEISQEKHWFLKVKHCKNLTTNISEHGVLLEKPIASGFTLCKCTWYSLCSA